MEAARPKVLIADDNVQNVELLEAYLSDVDCDVQTAFDGEETLAKVREDQPDLILLDIMMPKISGFEVCRKLKNNDATKDIQILMVTALNQVGDIERAVQAGTDDFLIKPVNKLELVTRVKSLLRVRRLQNELDRALEYLNEVEQARGQATAS
jgi:CheY-like chemotaxis protein